MARASAWTRRAAALLVAAVALPAAGATRELPQFAPAKHLGVASCASAQCHGAIAQEGTGKSPLLNEYRTWLRNDRHAKAYAALENDLSRTIARNMGLGDPTTASLCLDCHADNVPAERRGERFQLSDGVGCEACHGGAERWIESHAAEATSHADNVARGLYPTDDPESRARLCVSCHLGNARKPLTHRLMAAGHPRTTFELDTFTAIQPAHFLPNEGYRARKQVPTPAQLWAIGQAVAVEELARWLAHPTRSRDGAWPEFALYDCYSCHHAIGAQPLTPAASLGLRQGLPRLKEVRVLLYAEARRAEGGADGAAFEKTLRELNRTLGTGGDETRRLAGDLAGRAAASVERFRTWDPGVKELRGLGLALTDQRHASTYRTYTSAEQVTMALQAIISAIGKKAPPDVMPPLESALDRLFDATADDGRFRPETFAAALAQARSALAP